MRLYFAEYWPPGELRNLGKGVLIEFRPTVENMGRYWDAIGVAVCNGAELRIVH